MLNFEAYSSLEKTQIILYVEMKRHFVFILIKVLYINKKKSWSATNSAYCRKLLHNRQKKIINKKSKKKRICTVHHVKITNCISDDVSPLYISECDSTQKSRDNLEKAQNFISLKHFKFCKLLI